MVAAVVDVRRHLSLHLLQHLERGAAAEGLDGMLPIDVELLLQQTLALHALLHALRVLAVHQLVLHMDEQMSCVMQSMSEIFPYCPQEEMSWSMTPHGICT